MNISGLVFNLSIDLFFLFFQSSGSTPTSQEKSKLGLVASYGGDSDDEDDEDSVNGFDESKLLDHSKMACLLCKRQFQSKEQLMRHAQMSDLHKVSHYFQFYTC